MHIALLEDDIPQAQLSTHWLSAAGMDCVSFHKGADFCKAVPAQTFDLIFQDGMFSDGDSVEILIRTVDTHVSPLCAKLACKRENRLELATVYHKGYRLEFDSAKFAGVAKD